MKRGNVIGLILGGLLALGMSAPALASLSQGFTTTTTIPVGSLVSLDAKTTGAVDIANLDNIGRLFGVVVSPSAASISLSNVGSNQVQVVTSGTANVFVTNAGGPINVGDYLTVSSISGVAQKVGGTTSRVIGTAQTAFSGTGPDVTSRTINGHAVTIGQIPVVIGVSTYTSTAGKQQYVVPNWLQNLSNTLAGRSVSPIRIIIAGLTLMVALLCISVLLYAAVRNSIISIGRNPLSRSSVLRGLFQVIGIAVVILVLTAGAMYFMIAK